MLGALEIVVLEGEHDTGLDAEALLELGPLQTLTPCVSFLSRPLAALHLASRLPQNVGGHGGSFCNLRIRIVRGVESLKC